MVTRIQAGVYIDTKTCKILRVVREADLSERPANWELLADDPNTGLLAARQLALEGAYTTDPRNVQWARMYEGSLQNMDTLEALDKAQRLADEADQLTSEHPRTLDLLRRTVVRAPAGVIAAMAAATLLAAEMAGYTSFV
jgi:hypothetical protein